MQDRDAILRFFVPSWRRSAPRRAALCRFLTALRARACARVRALEDVPGCQCHRFDIVLPSFFRRRQIIGTASDQADRQRQGRAAAA